MTRVADRPAPALAPDSPTTALRGIGPKRAAALAAAGFDSVGDLLWHLPARYEDRRTVAPAAAIAEEGSYALVGRIEGLRSVRVWRRRLHLVRGRFVDASGELPVLWFNRPYLARQLPEGGELLLYGRVRRGKQGLELINPTVEPAERALHAGRVVPVYPAAAGFGPAAWRRILADLLERTDPAASLEEPLPEELLERHGLPRLGEALASLHRPPPAADPEALAAGTSPAHARLVFGELLELQLELGLVRARQRREVKRHRYRIGDAARARLERLLPFRLTGAQRRSLGEIVADLDAPHPMLRLLQGDVGCGKTAVAALAMAAAAEAGLQAAFMAPTELLAEQQARALGELLGDRWPVELVTRSAADLAAARRRLAEGASRLAVGTHALVQEGTAFARLGLAVVDEQHRFGVGQRRLLQLKGDCPDLLVMTATPIPRSLALTLYGDLALSTIDELPPGRTPVRTRVVGEEKRDAVYRWLAERLGGGGQAYVVLPLIDDSASLEAASIESMEADLRRRLAGRAVGVLHGRLDAEERDARMRAFAAGRLDVLVATTIVEVGVDVAAATVMVVESAERFGLAQLHQLRGRVGRGTEASHCVAIHGPRLTEAARQRLDRFAATSDGFELAEADLRLRGPGELLGRRQAGLPSFRVTDLARDRRWIETARREAARLLAERPAASAPLLARIERRAGERWLPFAGG